MRAATRATQRGSAYILVLGTGLMVSVMGLAALTAVRVEQLGAAGGIDLIEARQLARSALELGMVELEENPDWRTDWSEGAWISNKSLGRGTFSLEVTDPNDGDFTTGASDYIVMKGTGVVGDARYVLSVELVPYGPAGMDCLQYAVQTGERIYNYRDIVADAPLSANFNIGNYDYIDGSVRAAGFVWNNGTITGTIEQYVEEQEMPPTDLCDQYVSRATVINRMDLAGDDTLKELLLTPTHNPYGVANPDGIYLIDCQNHDITVKDVRIVGTLVFINTGTKKIKLDGGILWEPAEPNLPAMLTDGKFEWDIDSVITESNAHTNLNPVGTPFEGDGDADEDDEFPSVIKGLCYAAGQIEIKKPIDVEGIIITDYRLLVNGDLDLTHDPRLLNDPPPGFERVDRPMKALAGSFKQVVLPGAP